VVISDFDGEEIAGRAHGLRCRLFDDKIVIDFLPAAARLAIRRRWIRESLEWVNSPRNCGI
jgi:hypothetical protein